MQECAKHFLYYAPGKADLETKHNSKCKFGGGGCTTHSYCKKHRDPNVCPSGLEEYCDGKVHYSGCWFGNSATCHYCFLWQTCIDAVHYFNHVRIPYKVYKCAAWHRHVIVSAKINYGDHLEDHPRMKVSLGEVVPSKLLDIQYTSSTIPNNEYTSMAFATRYLSKGPTYAFDDVSDFDQQ